MNKLKEIGEHCKKFRVFLGYKQSNVAYETGYSKENVSSFECGRNNNAIIYNWYVEHGLVDFVGVVNYGNR